MDRFSIGIRSVRRKNEVYNTHTMSYEYKNCTLTKWSRDTSVSLFSHSKHSLFVYIKRMFIPEIISLLHYCIQLMHITSSRTPRPDLLEGKNRKIPKCQNAHGGNIVPL